jgi:hypothetical protein
MPVPGRRDDLVIIMTRCAGTAILKWDSVEMKGEWCGPRKEDLVGSAMPACGPGADQKNGAGRTRLEAGLDRRKFEHILFRSPEDRAKSHAAADLAFK